MPYKDLIAPVDAEPDNGPGPEVGLDGEQFYSKIMESYL